jgi:hypothetical protein
MTLPLGWTLLVIGLSTLPLATMILRHLRGRFPLLPQSPERTLRLEESIALDPRRRLHVVSCQGKRLIVLTGGPQDVSIGWLPES